MRGPCAKRVVECRIENIHPSGEVESAIGSNECENPQAVCPREQGEDYTKCKTICRQGGHAEITALRLAQRYGFARGATATITGHHWMCKSCGEALRDAGVKTVTLELA